MGEIVKIDYLRQEKQAAINTPSLEGPTLTKNFNKFCTSKEIWMPAEIVKKCSRKVKLADFQGDVAYFGCDLAAVYDLAAWTILLPPDETRSKWPDKFIFVNKTYLPEESVKKGPNAEIYGKFIREKTLTATSGNVTDYDVILDDMMAAADELDVIKLAYDSYNAT